MQQQQQQLDQIISVMSQVEHTDLQVTVNTAGLGATPATRFTGVIFMEAKSCSSMEYSRTLLF